MQSSLEQVKHAETSFNWFRLDDNGISTNTTLMDDRTTKVRTGTVYWFGPLIHDHNEQDAPEIIWIDPVRNISEMLYKNYYMIDHVT